MGIYEPYIFSTFPLPRKSLPFPWESHGNLIPMGNPIPMHTSRAKPLRLPPIMQYEKGQGLGKPKN